MCFKNADKNLPKLRVVVKRIPSDPCANCDLLLEPSKDLVEQCLNPWTREKAPSDKIEYIFPQMPDFLTNHNHICVDKADILQQDVDGKSSWFLANNIFLERTFDSYLMRYFWLKFECQSDTEQNQPIPQELDEALVSYFRTPISRRKPFALESPRKERGGSYYYNSFAFLAKIDLTCKTLLIPKNATQKKSSLPYIGTFFSCGILGDESQYKQIELPSNLRNFQLEDYIFYELYTRVSFTIETCAVLLSVDNKDHRKICKEILIENLEKFLYVPRILSSITLVRQCVLETKFMLETAEFQPSYVEKIIEIQNEFNSPREALRKIYDLKKEIARTHFQSILQKQGRTRLFGGFCKAELQQMSFCYKKAYQLLASIKAPIDIIEYVKIPKYGPVAFCNPKHPFVKMYLEQLELWNTTPKQEQRISRSKHEQLFAEMYKAVSKNLPMKKKPPA